MAAAAANTAQSHRPWPLVATSASRSTSRLVTASAPNRTLVCTGVSSSTGAPPQPWTTRPPRRDVTAKAGAAEVWPSSSPDAVTYSSSISTDMPLYEPPGASFDEYLLDRVRVFRAMFPDESRSQRLSDSGGSRCCRCSSSSSPCIPSSSCSCGTAAVCSSSESCVHMLTI